MHCIMHKCAYVELIGKFHCWFARSVVLFAITKIYVMQLHCIALHSCAVCVCRFLCSLYPVHCLCKRIILERKSKLWYFLFPGIYDKRSNSTQYRDACIYGIGICFIDTGFHTSTNSGTRVCFSMLSMRLTS